MSTDSNDTTRTTEQQNIINADRTRNTNAPHLVDEGHTASGDRLLSITCEGVRYYYAERNSTTLELRSMERVDSGQGVPTEVVASVSCMDVPDGVRLTLKLHGFRMTGRNSRLVGVMQ